MKIAIDAGHGMSNRQAKVYDPGAKARVGETTEADIVLEWALTGKEILGQMGIDTYLTRPTKRSNAPLAGRVPAAVKEGCTHFISLHCNAHPSPWATGAEVFYREIQDIPFAHAALQAAVDATGRDSRGVKLESASQHNRLAVLDFPGPSCLLEIGFISHPNDLAVMRERDTRIAFWSALGKALKEKNL